MTEIKMRPNGFSAKRVVSVIGKLFANVYVWIASVTCVFPIIWLVYSAMKTQKEFDVNSISLPASPTLDNFIHVFTTSDMPCYMFNSLCVTAASLLLILLLSFTVGYFFSRFEFKGRKILYGFFLIGMLIPVHSLMVPMYVIFSKLHLNNHLFALVLPYVSFQIPIGIYLVDSYIRSIPREMEEAAAIDGSNFSYTLFRIILPMTVPVLTTLGIIAFFYCWNEFSFALILTTDTNMRTVPLGLALFKGSYTTNYPVLMAGMVIAIAPALILYTIFSKNIINGMVSGAVKG